MRFRIPGAFARYSPATRCPAPIPGRCKGPRGCACPRTRPAHSRPQSGSPPVAAPAGSRAASAASRRAAGNEPPADCRPSGAGSGSSPDPARALREYGGAAARAPPVRRPARGGRARPPRRARCLKKAPQTNAGPASPCVPAQSTAAMRDWHKETGRSGSAWQSSRWSSRKDRGIVPATRAVLARAAESSLAPRPQPPCL